MSSLVTSTRILILSVGGSCAPLINAIREYRPDYVYFLCSSGPRGSEQAVDGPGDPCGDNRTKRCPQCAATVPLGDPKGPAIVAQAALPAGQYEKILLEDPDDLHECYTRVAALAASLSTRHPGPLQVIANYTGGTKTMSVALALVGTVTERWDLSLNRGARVDLVKVASGTDIPVVVDKLAVASALQVETIREHLGRFDYAGAESVLAQMSKRPLGGDFQSRVVQARQLVRAFDRWDRFDHGGALEVLGAVRGPMGGFVLPLKRLTGHPGVGASGYERVEDLLRNSERRAAQGRYDDAVARLYRATELLAQLRLRASHRIETAEVAVEELPETLGATYAGRAGAGGKVALGLRDAYALLAARGDPIGLRFAQEERKLLDALACRNASIGAHGLRALGERDYRDVAGVLGTFVTEATTQIGKWLGLPQLPREEILEACGFNY